MALGSVGRNLGEASGAITIDTSQARRAVGEMRSVGQDINRAMGTAGRGVDDFTKRFRSASTGVDSFISEFRRVPSISERIKSSLRSAGQSVSGFIAGLKGIRTELAAIGLAGGVLTGLGLRTAGSLEEAQIVLEDMVGSTEAATALMEQLREQAAKSGVPFGDLLQASRQLLPTLNRNTKELEKWIPIVRRVATLNRSEGITGAAFAINEALSSGGTDLVSLAERFNISRQQLRDALKVTGNDFAAALDLVLTRMGVLQSTADRMGETFNASFARAKDAAAQALAAGFTPLLQALTPLLQKVADFLNRVREANPEILKWGAGLAAVVAAGAPILLFLSQVAITVSKLTTAWKALDAAQKASLISGAKSVGGLLAVVGLAAAAPSLGLGLGKFAGKITGFGGEAVQQQTTADVMATVIRLTFIVVAGITDVINRIKAGLARAVAAFLTGVGGMVSAMGRFIQGIASLLPEAFGGRALDESAQRIIAFGEALGISQQAAEIYAATLDESRRQFLLGLSDRLGLTGGGTAAAGGISAGGTTFTPAPPDLSEFDEQIAEATTAYKEKVADIEERANEQRLQATRQFEQQRTNIIFEYNLQRAREAEDFARRRARQEEDFNRQLSDILAERTEREQEWAADLNDRITEIRQEGADRIAQIEEEGRIARERAERDHRLRLFDAARRLDATAVANEQRSFAIQQSDAAADLARRLEQERANLEQRIQQEQAGHEQRLEQARLADEQRIADMIEQFERQKEIEDEERAIALKRQREDHERQLAELQRSNQEQLREIETSKAKELATLKTEHLKQLAEIEKEKAAELKEYEEANQKFLSSSQQHNDQMLTAQETSQERQLDSHRRFWEEAEKLAKSAADSIENVKNDPSTKKPKITLTDAQGNPIGGFQSGGPVDRTGLAFLHRGEHVLSPQTTSDLRSVLGSFNQQQLLAAVAGGRGFNGTINVYAAPGMDAGAVARAVRGEMMSLFRSVSG